MAEYDFQPMSGAEVLWERAKGFWNRMTESPTAARDAELEGVRMTLLSSALDTKEKWAKDIAAEMVRHHEEGPNDLIDARYEGRLEALNDVAKRIPQMGSVKFDVNEFRESAYRRGDELYTAEMNRELASRQMLNDVAPGLSMGTHATDKASVTVEIIDKPPAEREAAAERLRERGAWQDRPDSLLWIVREDANRSQAERLELLRDVRDAGGNFLVENHEYIDVKNVDRYDRMVSAAQRFEESPSRQRASEAGFIAAQFVDNFAGREPDSAALVPVPSALKEPQYRDAFVKSFVGDINNRYDEQVLMGGEAAKQHEASVERMKTYVGRHIEEAGIEKATPLTREDWRENWRSGIRENYSADTAADIIKSQDQHWDQQVLVNRFSERRFLNPPSENHDIGLSRDL